MDIYRNRSIKEIIEEFPEIGSILEEYGIGCGPCTVGICQLKDILDIHKMEPEKEQELMLRIEAVIYPERGIKVSSKSGSFEPAEALQDYSPPLQRLVDEHVTIKRWLALVPAVVKNIDITTLEGVQIIEDGIDFIRSYADRLHHGKEEDILFKHFDTTAEIFQVIYEDHRIARNYVKEMLIALDKKDAASLANHLKAYSSLLAEHITKEDEILFPWLDRKLSEDQVEKISKEFEEAEQRINIDTQRYLDFLGRLETAEINSK